MRSDNFALSLAATLVARLRALGNPSPQPRVITGWPRGRVVRTWPRSSHCPTPVTPERGRPRRQWMSAGACTRCRYLFTARGIAGVVYSASHFGESKVSGSSILRRDGEWCSFRNESSFKSTKWHWFWYLRWMLLMNDVSPGKIRRWPWFLVIENIIDICSCCSCMFRCV